MSTLRRVLDEIQSERGPISLAELSRRLDVEQSALEGMIDFWIQKGRLRADLFLSAPTSCASDQCDASCPKAASCGHMTNLPRTFSLARDDK
jgi:hypothetical protein